MNFIIGFLTGITASMGLGGGFVLIIYITVFESVGQKAAAGINLLFFLPIALISVLIHARNKLIEWKLLPVICGVGVFGAGLGVLLLSFIDEELLRKIFAVLLLGVGLKELFHKKQKNA